MEVLPVLRCEGDCECGGVMSDCIHIEVCGKCYAEPKECGCYEPRREKFRFEIKDNCNDSEGTCCDVWFECSECHARFDYLADEWLMQENYCPACGREVEK